MKNSILLAFLLISLCGMSQSEIEPSPQYLSTKEGVVNECLAIITGERGVKRDWEAFRMLFDSRAQISVVVHDTNGNAQHRVYSLEQFVRLGMQYYEQDGFVEYEISSTAEEYNGIATVFQGYYAKELDIEEKGVNSYQLYFDGARWWITSLIWTSDRNGVTLPKKYDGPLK